MIPLPNLWRKPWTIVTAMIANLAVTTEKIANGAVTEDKIDDGAITADKIADGSITNEKIADDAVDTDQIADDAVDSAKIAAGAVDKDHLAGGFSKLTVADGTDAAANVTVSGMATGDELVSVLALTTKAEITTLADRTSEYVVGAGVLTKAAGTDERNNQIIIVWNDLT